MRIKDRTARLTVGEDDILMPWEDYVENLHNIDTEKQVEVSTCGFDGVRRGKYFGGEPKEE